TLKKRNSISCKNTNIYFIYSFINVTDNDYNNKNKKTLPCFLRLFKQLKLFKRSMITPSFLKKEIQNNIDSNSNFNYFFSFLSSEKKQKPIFAKHRQRKPFFKTKNIFLDRKDVVGVKLTINNFWKIAKKSFFLCKGPELMDTSLKKNVFIFDVCINLKNWTETFF
ncbi:hypothetical protein RFI_38080, partial [Reticulomyxa filosa]